MQNAVKIVIEAQLDEETIREIEVMRGLRLDHYRRLAHAPELGLEALKKVGMTEETTAEQLQANAYSTIEILESRLREPHVIYEEELCLYTESLEAPDA